MKKVIIAAVLAVAVFAVASHALVKHQEADTTVTTLATTDPGTGGGR